MANARIVGALAIREVKSRYGESWLGYASTYLAPLAWIIAIALAFSLFGRSAPVHTDTLTFIIAGLAPYAAFRYVVTSVERTTSVVRSLLIYPAVTYEHAVIAAALLELANAFIFYLLVAGGNYFLFGNGEMDHLGQFIFGMLLAWGLGASWGYLFAMLSRTNKSFAQIGQMLLRPSLFISGIFYTANELPERLFDILRWNPLLHAVDIAREGMLINYESRVASAGYAASCILILLVAGIIVSKLRRS